MDAAILLKGITKTFGETTAVRELDLVVPRGGLYGFIGPNGAGKTTSIRMIMSILFSDIHPHERPRIESAICPRSVACIEKCASALS